MARRRLNLPQRVVLVVALGAALYLVGSWITWRASRSFATGWTGYAPLTNAAHFPGIGPSRLHPWVQLAIWLALVGIWVGGSLLVLRDRAADRDAMPREGQRAPGSD